MNKVLHGNSSYDSYIHISIDLSLALNRLLFLILQLTKVTKTHIVTPQALDKNTLLGLRKGIAGG
jgi:hypothetical protein